MNMKKLCFIVNVDWFFHSHRRQLERKLSSTYETLVIAGKSAFVVDYKIETFEVRSRVPTCRGVYQLYSKLKHLEMNAIIIVVSPVMIIISHLLLRKRKIIFYNFSGLGFLRSKPQIVRNLIVWLLKVFPVKGKRVFVVQNSDDYLFLDRVFGLKDNFHLELIAGSGFENSTSAIGYHEMDELTLGYVGRIRKDKGVLDLLKAVSDLQKLQYKIKLIVWGELDDESRHGFSQLELSELKKYVSCMRGFANDKNEIFRSFNWFCLPSNGEGLSKAAIEASSFGIPLLLSDVEGNRDMINGNGFLFEYGNIENLKKVLINILNLSKREYENMSKMSRTLFEMNWTMEAVNNKWIKILSKYDTLSAQ